MCGEICAVSLERIDIFFRLVLNFQSNLGGGKGGEAFFKWAHAAVCLDLFGGGGGGATLL